MIDAAPARGLFVTGTDTGVGKTRVAAALIRTLVHAGLKVAGMKPVAAGAELTTAGWRNSDALTLIAAANITAQYETVNPYCFAPPVSPHIAAGEAGIPIDPQLIRSRFDALARAADCVIVEGAGGWHTPIDAVRTMADVAGILDLPVLLVVGLRLGCLNHSLLTAQALSLKGMRLKGWIATSIDRQFDRPRENLAQLETFLGPPSAILPYQPDDSVVLPLPATEALRLIAA